MMLSTNFSLEELTKSSTALRKGISNEPDEEQLYSLRVLAETILQPVRNHYGIPFTISSGFRSHDLSQAIGSSVRSQHGCNDPGEAAADFEVPGISNMALCYFIKSCMNFDQLILECYTGGNTGWVHCSISELPRKELLTFDRTQGYRKGLLDK